MLLEHNKVIHIIFYVVSLDVNLFKKFKKNDDDDKNNSVKP
jgi:hypothetical protein